MLVYINRPLAMYLSPEEEVLNLDVPFRPYCMAEEIEQAAEHL